jgi:hypothetical protein
MQRRRTVRALDRALSVGIIVAGALWWSNIGPIPRLRLTWVPPSGYFADSLVVGTHWLYDPSRLPRSIDSLKRWTSDRRVPSAEAAADLRKLPGLLSSTYGRYRDYAKAHLDVRALCDSQARKVERQPTTLLSQAFGPVYSRLETAVPDQHLSMLIRFVHARIMDERDRQAWEFRGPPDRIGLAERAAGAVPATARIIPVISPDGAVSRSGSVSVFGDQGVGQLTALGYVPQETTAPLDRQIYLPYYARRRTGTTCVLRLGTLDPAYARPQLARFVGDAASERSCRVIIVDLRGNSGGFVDELVRWARGLQLGMAVDPGASSVFFGDSPMEDAITRWNLRAYNWRYVGADPPGVVRSARAYLRHTLIDVARDRPDRDVQRPAWTPGRRWGGTCIVLIDRYSQSAAEVGAVYLSMDLGAIIVGERSRGLLGSTGVLQYRLPNTGLVWDIPRSYQVVRETGAGERIGIPVDVGLSDPFAPDAAIARLVPEIMAHRAPRRAPRAYDFGDDLIVRPAWL